MNGVGMSGVGVNVAQISHFIHIIVRVGSKNLHLGDVGVRNEVFIIRGTNDARGYY